MKFLRKSGSSIPSISSVVVSSNRGTFIKDGWNKTSDNLTLYVDNVNGSDTTGDGSSSNPYATVVCETVYWALQRKSRAFWDFEDFK